MGRGSNKPSPQGLGAPGAGNSHAGEAPCAQPGLGLMRPALKTGPSWNEPGSAPVLSRDRAIPASFPQGAPLHVMNAYNRRRPAAPARATKSPELRMGGGHDFTFLKLGGGEIDLRQYAGRPMLIVNVASACGFTPQYRELQALWDAKKDTGLIVLGVPSNDFGAQEPGDDKAIEAFCAGQYHHPFYEWIARELGADALPRWNFHKFLIGKDGAIEAAFPSKAAPLGPAVVGAIEKALNA